MVIEHWCYCHDFILLKQRHFSMWFNHACAVVNHVCGCAVISYTLKLYGLRIKSRKRTLLSLMSLSQTRFWLCAQLEIFEDSKSQTVARSYVIMQVDLQLQFSDCWIRPPALILHSLHFSVPTQLAVNYFSCKHIRSLLASFQAPSACKNLGARLVTWS